MEKRGESKEINIIKRPIKFLFRWRPFPIYELLAYIFMYASVPMLAYGLQTYDMDIIRVIIFTILALYSGFFAALIWNDITDVDIDAVVHPDRPITGGRITSKKFFAIALIFSAMTFIFSILVSFWCFMWVGLIALFVTFHNKFLKKRIKLPAYSEIFTPLQWILVAIFGYIAIWTALPQASEFIIRMPIYENVYTTIPELQNMILLVLFTYFADSAHDLPEGIHDVKGDRKLGVKTYATSFGEKNAARISFGMFFFSGILGMLLFIRTVLSPIFLIPFLAIWVYTLYWSYKLVKADNNDMKELGTIVGRKGFDYLLFAYVFIFIDILLQLVWYHYIS